MVGKVGRQGLEAASHTAFTARNQREMDAGAQLTPYSVQKQSVEGCCPLPGCIYPPQLTQPRSSLADTPSLLGDAGSRWVEDQY